eukprot:1160884-Pelagomonas_calceolata.AAC.2
MAWNHGANIVDMMVWASLTWCDSMAWKSFGAEYIGMMVWASWTWRGQASCVGLGHVFHGGQEQQG